MKLIQFIFPFLFVRNWHNGARELSRSRSVLFFGFLALLGLGFLAAYLLQAPVQYSL